MDSVTAARLLALNHEFYDRFGEEFSATRQRLQPGVKKILETLKGDESILDLGCGNGELARELARRAHQGSYLGLDFSLPLLQDAQLKPDGFAATFREVDLTKLSALSDRLLLEGAWPLITAFAVLHHIPSHEMRFDILKAVRGLLREDGQFILSNWQFLNSEKLKSRIQPWSKVGLADKDVEQGDYLLDWRGGGRGLRYVHYFSAEELQTLAGQAGMRVSESFLSDGDGARLGLYQVWMRT